jgi:hypothetical protein
MNIKELKRNKKTVNSPLPPKSRKNLPCWIRFFQGIKDGFAHGFQASPTAKSVVL